MSIASEITRINTNIANAYTACNGKGATMPASGSQNSANLATTISSIPAGGGAGIGREIVNGKYQIPTTSFTIELPSGVTDIGKRALYYLVYQDTNITSVDFNDLTTISGENAMLSAFSGCSNLTSVDFGDLSVVNGTSALASAFSGSGLTGSIDLSGLIRIGHNPSVVQYSSGNYSQSQLSSTFQNCSGITSANLSNIVTIEGSDALYYTFSNCTGLTSISFTNLETIGSPNIDYADRSQFRNCFYGCTNLTSLSFPNLERIYCTGSTIGRTTYAGTFGYNNKIESIYLPKLHTITYATGAGETETLACECIFSGCTSLTEIHFGSANRSAIEATAGYSTLWGLGAGAATVYFDL